jgi:hypothetical protein
MSIKNIRSENHVIIDFFRVKYLIRIKK